MRAVVVYESMYGNTHVIAEAIADGLRAATDVAVLPVGEADTAKLADADLLVVGGPTHVHGMSRSNTRSAAVEAAEKPGSTLSLDAGAGGPGVREWLDELGTVPIPAAAFDTRIGGPAWVTGRASKRIAGQLRRHGARLMGRPQSFLVTKDSELKPGEAERARTWAASLAADAATARHRAR
jgi:hypothetical protein